MGLICRCRDEFFIKEFCDYYLSQGIDDIYILDDESEDQSIYDFADNNKYENVFVNKCDRQYQNAFTETNYLNTNDESNKLFYKIKH